MSQIQQQENPQRNIFKCVLVGDGGVGKTSFASRVDTGRFTGKYIATLGVDVSTPHFVQYYNQKPVDVTLNMWDTAGQEKFSGMGNGYYIQADCAFVFFDLTSRITFKNVPKWIRDISEYTNRIVLIGNKSDIVDGRKISYEDVLQFTSGKIPYFEISCKNYQGIDRAIQAILDMLFYK